MAVRWFTTLYSPRWTPEAGGYTPAFAELVQLIRRWFKTVRNAARTGDETGTRHWISYTFGGQQVGVCVSRFVWKRYVNTDGYVTPQFILEFQMSNVQGVVYVEDQLIIQFPDNFPIDPPFCLLKKKMGHPDAISGSHKHHILKGGWMCIFDKKSDWNPNRDTIVAVLNLALKWVHDDYHGWR